MDAIALASLGVEPKTGDMFVRDSASEAYGGRYTCRPQTGPRVVRRMLPALYAVSEEEMLSKLLQVQFPLQDVKACTQCGATKTPQWREGPEGPKTLCNACGVKRCRQSRTGPDGQKPATQARKASGKSIKKMHLSQQNAESASRKRARSEMPMDDQADLMHRRGRLHTPDSQTPTCSSNHRPTRKAAAVAATRTAEYAAYGQWNENMEHQGTYGSQLLMDTAPMAESADSMGRSSATAEELSYHPTSSPAPSGAEAVSPLMAIDSDSGAAINLMAMAMRSPQDFRKHFRSATNRDQIYADLDSSTMEELREHAESILQSTGIPEGKRIELQQLLQSLEELDMAASRADIAVAAVARVLAAKQNVAIQAREAQASAQRSVHGYLASLLSAHGASILHSSAPTTL